MPGRSPSPASVSSPASTSSASSAVSTATERPTRSSTSPAPLSPRAGPSSPDAKARSTSRSNSNPARPSLLCPPATVISPPSPIESTSEKLPQPLGVPATSSPSGYSSPAEEGGHQAGDGQGFDWSTPPPKPSRSPAAGRGGADTSEEGSPRPIAAEKLSLPPRFISSPSASPGPTTPGTSLNVPYQSTPPAQSTPGSESEHYFASPFSSPSLPMPSSPHSYPKRLGHRRESSTHRVKETPNGQQRNAENGDVMVNQYRIGKGLGKGGFAKVELAVDVGSGIEYAIKEFSQSRLHTQSLQEKQRQAARGRMLRGRGGPGRGGPRRSARRCSMSGSGTDSQDSDGQSIGEGNEQKAKGGKRRVRETSEPDANDPLGLIRREIAVMKKLDHPNIVLLYEAISVPPADALYLVLEYMPGGVLMKVHLGDDRDAQKPPFVVEQTREYFRQLILGLEYLHSNGVVHRDIKPDNILLSKDRTIVKLCDFGVSEMFVVADSDDRIKKSGGSPAFLSPESFTSHTHEVHGKLVDIWALGVTLYCMLTGSLPFNTENPIELFEMVQNDEPKIPDEWPEDQKDLIRQMLRKEPSFRIHLFLLREHPWVTENGENAMISRDDNLYRIGKVVEEPTQEELSSAIGALRGVFTVIRAVQKMRRLQLARRSANSSPQPSPPIRNSTLDSVTSTEISGRTSGSMDSYTSDPQTENTSMEGGADRAERESTVTEDDPRPAASPGKADKEEDGEIPPLKLDTLKLPERGERPSSPGMLLGTALPGGESEQVAAERTGESGHSTPASSGSSLSLSSLDAGLGRVDIGVLDSPAEDKDVTPQPSQPQPGADQDQVVDSPVNEDGKSRGPVDSPVQEDAPAEQDVQIVDSPDEEEEVSAPKKVRPRPRPRS